MLSKSSWLHLRFPFSYFLLPIFLLALAISPNITSDNLLWTFIIVHFLLYPASNGYNSYFDKDEKSIGALKHPPPVDKGLYYLALLFDTLAIVLGYLMINLTFAVMLLVYGLVSKAYSHPAIRLKKHAITSLLITGIFQGLFTVIMCYVGINDFSISQAIKPTVILPGILSCLMLCANYPMTQVYQHEEDHRHGDATISMQLGITGTFYFTMVVFAMAVTGFVWYLSSAFSPKYAMGFVLSIAPVVIYFLYWFAQVLKDLSKADYTHTMWLNFISATCLNVYFTYLFLDSSGILQAL